MSWEIVSAGDDGIEKVAHWVRNLGILSTGKLVMHQKIAVPKEVTDAVKANEEVFGTLAGWNDFCDRVGKINTSKCKKQGYGEWGNTLHESLLKGAGIELDVAKETNREFQRRLGGGN